MKLLNGNLLAQKILQEVKKNTRRLAFKPQLHIISCQDDRLTKIYLAKKRQFARLAGIKTKIYRFKNPGEERLFDKIKELNQSDDVTGILIQLPLPKRLNLEKMIWRIHPLKDVDGFQMREFKPPTPQAILDILTHYNLGFLGRRVHIIGQGFLVGKPLAILLKKSGAKVTFSDRQTRRVELVNFLSQADVVVAACGERLKIPAAWLTDRQVVIDAGTSMAGGRQQGDIYSQKIAQRVRAITPVPGGVGPVAVAELMKNVYLAAIKQMASQGKRLDEN